MHTKVRLIMVDHIQRIQMGQAESETSWPLRPNRPHQETTHVSSLYRNVYPDIDC